MAQNGTFIWNELCTRDTTACTDFYSKLLGWTSRAMDMPEGGSYTIWRSGDTDTGGMLKIEGPQWEGIPNHWMAYVAVDDVDAAAAKTEASGGQVTVPPFDVPGVGRICVIRDPSGAALSLMTPSADDSAG